MFRHLAKISQALGPCAQSSVVTDSHRYTSRARIHTSTQTSFSPSNHPMDGSLGQLVDTLPPLASDHLFPQRDLSVRTCHGQDVACEGPRDSPYRIGEERVRVVGPVRQELGGCPCRGGGRSEMDLDGSVLCRRARRTGCQINVAMMRSLWTYLPTRGDVFTGKSDIRCPSDIPHPITMRVQGGLDFGARVGIPERR